MLSGIDCAQLERFILNCQDPEDGGLGDRPGNQTDVFHTFFGLAALSLIDHKKYGLDEVDPLFAIPKRLTQRLHLRLADAPQE